MTQDQDLKSLSPTELQKLRKEFLKGIKDSKDIHFTMVMWARDDVFEKFGLGKYVSDMVLCQQNLKWHSEGTIIKDATTGQEARFDPSKPEHWDKERFPVVWNGSVWDHTLCVMEETFKDPEHDYIDLLAAFFHDIGKPPCADIRGYAHEGDTWKATKGHDKYSKKIAEEWMTDMGFKKSDIETVSWLVEHHMQAHELNKFKSKAEVWKILQHKHFPRLVRLATADNNGSYKLVEDTIVKVTDYIKRPEAQFMLKTPMPRAMISERDLVKLGYGIDDDVRKALDIAYRMQIDQDLKDKEKLLKHTFGMIKSFRRDKKKRA